MAAPDPIPRSLARVELDPDHARALGASELRLRRAWPREENRLLLEYATPEGRIVGGQWARDPLVLDQAFSRTGRCAPNSPVFMVQAGAERVLIQGGGADRELPALAGYLRSSGAALISHRIERRAVARIDGTHARFVKFVRSAEILQSACALGRVISALPLRTFDVPRQLEVNVSERWVAWSPLAGRSWRDAMLAGESTEASRAVGRALREIHASAGAPGVPVHDAGAECRVLARWVRHALAYGLVEDSDPQACEVVSQALGRDPMPACLIHRDFHERQVLIGADGRVGVLDFDTLAVGEGALDLGNLLAHLDHARERSPEDSPRLARHEQAFLEGYAPSEEMLARAALYRTSTRLRLRCLHAFRPQAHAASGPPAGIHGDLA